jgi:hypothetical protein
MRYGESGQSKYRSGRKLKQKKGFRPEKKRVSLRQYYAKRQDIPVRPAGECNG